MMSPEPPPFVGVCGIRNPYDYDQLANLAPAILEDTSAFIMAGIKDSTVQLDPARLSPLVRPFIHCDYKPDEQYEHTLANTLAQTDQFAQGLQLNVLPWMDTSYESTLAAIKRQYPHLRIMLQAHREIMDAHSPGVVGYELARLPVDYILFDPSQSKGEPYETATMQRFVNAARRYAPWAGAVVAGGLGDPDSMRAQFAPIACQEAAVSCDAYLKLQNPNANRLDWLAVGRYLLHWKRTISNLPIKMPISISVENNVAMTGGATSKYPEPTILGSF